MTSSGVAEPKSAPQAQAGRRPLRALLVANGVSGFGNEAAAVAIPWFVLQESGDPGAVGITGMAMLVPYVIATFLGGSLVDRLGFRRMSVVADLASGVTVAAIPLLHWTVGLHLGAVVALVFLGTLLDAPGITARQSMIPEIAGGAALPLERANAVFESVQQFKNVLGPLAAGVLIALFSPGLVLLLDGVSFAVSALLIGRGVPDVVAARAAATAGFRATVDRTLEGLRFIRGDRVLRWLAVMSMLGNLRIGPLFLVLMPVYADALFASPAALGVVLAAFGASAFVGALAYGAWARRVPRRVWYLGSQVGLVACFVLLVALPGVAGATAALALAGITSGTNRPFTATIRQERTPLALRGRVFGANLALIELASPLGMLAAGWLLATVDLRATLAVFAAVGVAQLAVAVLLPAFAERELQASRRIEEERA